MPFSSRSLENTPLDSESSTIIVQDNEMREKEKCTGRHRRLLKAPAEPAIVGLKRLARESLTRRVTTSRELKTLRWASTYSMTLTPRKESKALLSGRWTNEEVETLKMMREDQVHTRIIADRLGRCEKSIKSKIRGLCSYFRDHNKELLVEGP